MNLLALETSTEMCSVALAVGDAVDAIEVSAGQRHSQLLNGLIIELLTRNKLDRQALQGIAFGNGPGAFTGLRIACGVAQGLALGLDLRVAPVSTLMALAEQAHQLAGHARVITALDARMGETYFAAWERTATGWQAHIAPCLAAPNHLPLPQGEAWVGIGSGFDSQPELRTHLAAHLGDVIDNAFPRAREIASIGLRIFASGESVLPEEALPFYLRDKVAFTIAEREARKAEAA